MYPRTEFEMTEQDLKELLEACKPTPVMFLTGGTPMYDTPQENANRAWAALGKKMGFNSDTVEPAGKGQRFFTAVPCQVEEAPKPHQVDPRIQAQRDASKARVGQPVTE